jgi:short-subunit dehydrogenase
MLINNIEERDPKGAKFHKASDESLIQTINMNSFPLVFMTKFLGPDLKERVNDSTKSAIINMTSAYADYP